MTAFWRIVGKFAPDLFKQDKMKHIFTTLCVLCGISFALTSCLGDDNTDTTSYNDAAITQFTMGKINCYTQSTSSKTGNDTIIKSTLTGSNYPMTIDHIGGKIYNQKLLPVGSDVKHLPLASISTKNGGVAFIKSMTSDSLRSVNTSDSLDFSQPRLFRVYSNSGQHFRDYTVTVNVSATSGTTFAWKKVASDKTFADFANQYLVAFGDTVMLVNRGTVVKNDVAYRLNGTEIESSTDLNNWQTVASADLKQLVGAGTVELFAIDNDGNLKHSTDDGQSWQDELLDDDKALLPAENIATVCFPFSPADNTDYMLMVGNSQQDNENVTIWRKISQYEPIDNNCKWVYMPVDANNYFTLDRQDGLSMTYYNGSILAVGSLMALYDSRDQGITWKTTSSYALPENLNGTLLSITADKAGRLWLVSDSGEIWVGSEE